jgi:hypothetical protein
MNHIKTIVFIATLSPELSFACSFDTDCSPGSKCAKDRGAIEGFCVGGR